MSSSTHRILWSAICIVAAVGCSGSGTGGGPIGSGGSGAFAGGGVGAGSGAGGAGNQAGVGGTQVGGGGSGATSGEGGSGAAGGAPACPPGLPASFQPAPVGYALPPARCSVDWTKLAETYTPVRYSLLDVSGDDRADMVIFHDDCDAALGSERWDVYLAGDPGFAAAPAPFSIPPARCGVKFDQVSESYTPLRYAVLDLTGDKIVDLVVYRDDCDTNVGTSRWDVYPGSASGFAPSPTPYALPAPRCSVKFDQLAETYTPLRYSLLDLTGDALPDLVVEKDDCDAAIGTQRWDVYAGSASGFSPTAAPFAIPAPRCQVAFDQIAEAYTPLRYTLIDLNADAISDLVVHEDDCDAAVGTSRWDVYFASPAGFSAAPAAYGLPAPRCQAAFDSPAETYGPVDWSLVDLTCDGQPDLVVTRDDCDAALGTSKWDVYLGASSGFTPNPQNLGIPAPRCQSKFEALADVYGGANYSVFNLEGKQRPALVVYDDDCDGEIGIQRWDVYPLK